MKQLAWNEQEFKKSMHRINIQDTEIRGLLDQVNLSSMIILPPFKSGILGTPGLIFRSVKPCFKQPILR